jgi:hypothetical protein
MDDLIAKDFQKWSYAHIQDAESVDSFDDKSLLKFVLEKLNLEK